MGPSGPVVIPLICWGGTCPRHHASGEGGGEATCLLQRQVISVAFSPPMCMLQAPKQGVGQGWGAGPGGGDHQPGPGQNLAWICHCSGPCLGEERLAEV